MHEKMAEETIILKDILQNTSEELLINELLRRNFLCNTNFFQNFLKAYLSQNLKYCKKIKTYAGLFYTYKAEFKGYEITVDGDMRIKRVEKK